MKSSMQYLQSAIVGGLIATLVVTQTAFTQMATAQEPSAQAAPQSTQTQPAPIERQNPATSPSGNATLTPEAQARARLLSAHTIYVARSTQDANFPVSPDDAYNLILANLRKWARFQIVDSVAQADLVIQLRDAVHASVVNDINDTGSSVYYLPSFQLTIADPSTLSPIWTVSSSVPTAVKHKNQTALVSAAATNVVSQLKLLTGDQLTAQDQAAQKQLSHYYKSRVGLLIGIGAAATALSVGLALYFSHRARNNQDAFCQAHNIPPNMCLGG